MKLFLLTISNLDLLTHTFPYFPRHFTSINYKIFVLISRTSVILGILLFTRKQSILQIILSTALDSEYKK